jgi:opacity protein-like surface antigen
MRWLTVPLAMVLLGQPASAAEVSDFLSIDQSDWTILMRPYVGVGGSYIHHTGYDRDTTFSAEQWEIGGKAFAGFAVTPALNVEVAYHYLNKTPLKPELFGATEQSYAVAGSLMLFTKRFRLPWEGGFHRWFVRGGAAYKHITEDNILNPGPSRQVEDGVAAVIGGGVEIEFTNSLFGRVEYEYISKVGTERAINVQHTPISASLGLRF